MKLIKFFLPILALFFVGCSYRHELIDYQPKNYAKFSGSISMGYFQYLPYLSGKVAEHQVENSTWDTIYFDYPIAQYVKKATELELQKTGIIISENSPYVLSADIKTLYCIDTTYDHVWYYTINYKIMDKMSNEILYSKEFSPQPIKRKTYFAHNIISELILSAYDEFIRDENIKKFLTEKK